jgi:hypothetical protein
MHGPQGPLEFGGKQEIGIAVPCFYTSQFQKWRRPQQRSTERKSVRERERDVSGAEQDNGRVPKQKDSGQSSSRLRKLECLERAV